MPFRNDMNTSEYTLFQSNVEIPLRCPRTPVETTDWKKRLPIGKDSGVLIYRLEAKRQFGDFLPIGNWYIFYIRAGNWKARFFEIPSLPRLTARPSEPSNFHFLRGHDPNLPINTFQETRSFFQLEGFHYLARTSYQNKKVILACGAPVRTTSLLFMCIRLRGKFRSESFKLQEIVHVFGTREN